MGILPPASFGTGFQPNTMKKIIIVVAAAVAIVIIAVAVKNCSSSIDEEPGVRISSPPNQTKSNKREISVDVKKEQETYAPTSEEQAVIDSTEAVLYGKVVDQKNTPVSGAEIVCLPNHDPWVSGLRRTVIKANQNGEFLLREANAPSIHVSVSAPGYYTTNQSRDSFGFAEVPSSAPKGLRLRSKGATNTSKANPKIFTLRKMGAREPLLHRSYADVIKKEQTYLIGQNPSQSILVKYSLDPTPKRMHANGWEVYNWGFEISVQGGGLIKAEVPNEEIPASFIAPMSGYQPSVRFEFDASMDDKTFKRDLKSQFFAKFTDGTYARFSVDYEMDPKRPFGKVESWFNPSGQQTTEFDSSIQITNSP
jgi:hypothetical protein